MPRVAEHFVTIDCREAVIRRWQRLDDHCAKLVGEGLFPIMPPGRIWGYTPPLPEASIEVDSRDVHSDDLLVIPSGSGASEAS